MRPEPGSAAEAEDDVKRLPVAPGGAAAGLSWRLLLRHRWPLIGSIATFSLAALAGVVPPLALGRIVDIVDTGGRRSELIGPVAAIAVSAAVALLATSLSVALLARAAEPALADLREQVLERAVHLDSEEIDEVGEGDLLSRVGDDVRLVSESVTSVIPLLVGSILAIVFTAGGILSLDWRLGVAALLTAPVYVTGLRWYLPRSGPYYRREREANGERAEALLTGLNAAGTLRALGLADRQQEEVDRTSWKSAQIAIDVYRLLTRFFARTNRAEAIGLLLVLGTGFFLVRADEVTVGAVTAAALFFHRLFNPIGAVLALFDEVQSAGASMARLVGVALLPSRAAVAEPKARRGPAPLRVRRLFHEYVAGHPAVNELDLDLTPGERLAVVGSTGAGKSTLGAVIAGRLRPTRGDVLVDGDPVTDRTIPVSLITQEVHVFAASVRDNLTLAAPQATDEEVERALRSVGAWGWVAALPSGTETVIGDGGHQLTPAQAQHLALARAVLGDPSLIVLDEATAEAGSAGARDLEAAAQVATQDRTAVVIAHRLTQAEQADRILVMDRGRVVEEGRHSELVAGDGGYARLWAAWSADGQ